MTSESPLRYIPSNRGYIVGVKKLYGTDVPIENGSNVKLISEDQHLHVWKRRGYVESKLGKNETDWDGFTVVHRRRPVVRTRPMRPCPAEAANSGMCLERNNPEHRNFFYHFTKYCDGHPVTRGDGKIMCKYRKFTTDESLHCWEEHNTEHCNVFFHI